MAPGYASFSPKLPGPSPLTCIRLRPDRYRRIWLHLSSLKNVTLRSVTNTLLVTLLKSKSPDFTGLVTLVRVIYPRRGEPCRDVIPVLGRWDDLKSSRDDFKIKILRQIRPWDDLWDDFTPLGRFGGKLPPGSMPASPPQPVFLRPSLRTS